MNSNKEILQKLRESRRLKEESDDAGFNNFKKLCMENPTWKKINKICTDHGYKLAPLSYIDVLKNGAKLLNMNIIDRNEKYYPEIYIDQIKRSEKVEFRIQTSAYGVLSIEECDKFIECITAARDMIEEIEKIDLFTLYNDVEEED